MRSPAGPRRVFLLGHGIAYSASPAMHRAAYRALALGWTYELLEVSPVDLERAVLRLREDEVAGANVTIPHKVAVIEHLDGLAPEATRAGSVNTIRGGEGRLIGHNTDVVGLTRALEKVGLSHPAGVRAVVLGAGGSARAAMVALEGAEVVLVARRPEAAPRVGIEPAAGLDHGPATATVMAWDDPEVETRIRSADVLINATPLGRDGELPRGAAALPEQGAVIDLVYVSGGTPLVRRAREAGRPVADGWDLLLWQGAASFQIWTGMAAPEDVMRRALAECSPTPS